jgi:HEAT repeat protein
VDLEVRRTALWAMTQLDGDAARGAYIEVLTSDDPELRATAARALGRGNVNPRPWPRPRPMPRPFP